MSSEQIAVSVEELGKRYEIYPAPVDRLKQMLLPRIGASRKRYYEEFWALRDVSLSVKRGETVAIIGRNGSGKSTLLQAICGTLSPTTGKVEVRGRIAALLELGAGFNPEFTGSENVRLSGLLYGISEKQMRDRYQAIVDFADIGGFIDQPVKTYSSGMYVRLAFAIAAHVDADTLVIDEALSVGDARFTQKCMRFLREFQSRGTLVFVSHDTGAVTSLCSRAIWLEGGSVIMDGSAREVVEHYLAAQHAADRALSGASVELHPQNEKIGVAAADPADDSAKVLEIPNGAPNPIRVFEFDPDSAKLEFGAGQARITSVALLAPDGVELQLTSGGEVVELAVNAEACSDIDDPIIGFYVKDRLGQRLFGDNTYQAYARQSRSFPRGSRFQALFQFRIPILPHGEYSVDVALATGTQEDHTQQHWIHDALVFRATEHTIRHGLVGIPMHRVKLFATE